MKAQVSNGPEMLVPLKLCVPDGHRRQSPKDGPKPEVPDSPISEDYQ
jgi:hypothetical protein